MTRMVVPFPFEPGKTIIDGRFLVQGELGQGGMGRCYRVEQLSLERICVLKMLAPKLHRLFKPDQDARALLEHEAKTLGLLAGVTDSWVQVFERGQVDVVAQCEGQSIELDLPFYTMELLQGFCLELVLDRQRRLQEFLPWELVFSFASQMARAFAAAHARGVIHRDIKPDNLFIHRRPDHPPKVKVIDPGIATREGQPYLRGTGTLRYAAPELLARTVERESTKSDIYPLGLVFYETAALRPPFVVENLQDYVRAHIYEESPPLPRFRPGSPLWYSRLAVAMLAKNPKDRPTGQEVGDEIDAKTRGIETSPEVNEKIAALLTNVGGHVARQRGSRASARSQPGRQVTLTASSGALGSYSFHAGPIVVPTMPLAQARGTAPAPAAQQPGPSADRGPEGRSADPLAPIVPAPVILERVGPRGPDEVSASRDPAARAAPVPKMTAAYDVSFLAAPELRDVDDVPEFKSMAGVFENGDDDTRYQTSPLEEGIAAAPNTGPSSLGPLVAHPIEDARQPLGVRSAGRAGPGRVTAVAAGIAIACLALGVGAALQLHLGERPQASTPAQAVATIAVEAATAPSLSAAPSSVAPPASTNGGATASAPNVALPVAPVVRALPPAPPHVGGSRRPAERGVAPPAASTRAQAAASVVADHLGPDDELKEFKPLDAEGSSPKPAPSSPLFSDWLVRPGPDAGLSIRDKLLREP